MSTNTCHQRPMRPWSRLAMLALLAVGMAAGAQDDPGDTVPIWIQWIPDTTGDAIRTPYLMFVAHDGRVDFFDHQRPASDLLELVLQPQREVFDVADLVRQLHDLLAADDAVVGGLYAAPYVRRVILDPPPPLWPSNPTRMRLDPERHRFVSYVGRVQPSDDAFVGNEDPYRIELFDAQGRFRGPISIDILGNQVMDAGLCANLETNLQWLDWDDHDIEPPQPPDCVDGEGRVHFHPGLNGSQRNPDGEPRRVLGGTLERERDGDLHYDLVDADFSQPGYRLGRLVITRGHQLRHPVTGSWYSPDKDGEGFNIELLEPGPGETLPRLQAHWYTYAPDGSGGQLWLTGIASASTDTPAPSWRIDLLRTEGGRFASTDNPALVEREPWGTVELVFHSCSTGQVSWQPLDPDWPEGSYDIHRLSPAIEGSGWLCNEETSP